MHTCKYLKAGGVGERSSLHQYMQGTRQGNENKRSNLAQPNISVTVRLRSRLCEGSVIVFVRAPPEPPSFSRSSIAQSSDIRAARTPIVRLRV